MIKIKKNRHAPIVRFTKKTHSSFGKEKWKVATKKIINDYISNSTPFVKGKYKYNADFGSKDFAKLLLKCQGHKCCYCEKKVFGGQLEHYRPKAAWQQSIGSKKYQPGYYWLAYKWENMLISCSDCNQSGQKGILFPVFGLIRAKIHTDDCAMENPVIINPAEEDPTLYISFNKDVPVEVDVAVGRGKKNIEIFKLKDRADIKEIRYDKFYKYETEKLIANIPFINGIFSKKRINEAKAFLLKAQHHKESFSGMIIENIRKKII